MCRFSPEKVLRQSENIQSGGEIMENQPNTAAAPTETKFCQHCGQKIPKDAVL